MMSSNCTVANIDSILHGFPFAWLGPAAAGIAENPTLPPQQVPFWSELNMEALLCM